MQIIDLTRADDDALSAMPDHETAAAVVVDVGGRRFRLYAHQARAWAAEMLWAAVEAEGDAPAGWPNRPPPGGRYESVNDPDAGGGEL